MAPATIGARRRSGRRPRPDGRSPRGARGSGGCGRSRAGSRAATPRPGRDTRSAPRSGCVPACPAPRPPSSSARRGDRPIGASTMPALASSVPPHEREVAPLDLVVGQRGHQTLVRGRRPRHDEQARGAAVESVHDAGPPGITDGRDLGVAAEQAVDERAVGCAGAGVHDEARRLVDDDQVVVGVDHGEHDSGIGVEGRRLRGRHLHVRARRPRPHGGCDSLTASPFTVTPPAATSAEASLRLSPVTIATTRSSRSPSSAAGISSITSSPRAPRLRPPGPPSGVAGSSTGVRNVTITSRMPPITTHESATLNTGHHCRSMKSTTPPLKNPSPRKARSARLPSAPPRMRPSATAPARLVTCVPARARRPRHPTPARR